MRLSFDPFSEMLVFAVTVPLYLVVFAAVAIGILVGGVGAWLGQGMTRRRARDRGRQVRRLEGETERLRSRLPEETTAGRVALPAPR